MVFLCGHTSVYAVVLMDCVISVKIDGTWAGNLICWSIVFVIGLSFVFLSNSKNATAVCAIAMITDKSYEKQKLH